MVCKSFCTLHETLYYATLKCDIGQVSTNFRCIFNDLFRFTIYFEDENCKHQESLFSTDFCRAPEQHCWVPTSLGAHIVGYPHCWVSICLLIAKAVSDQRHHLTIEIKGDVWRLRLLVFKNSSWVSVMTNSCSYITQWNCVNTAFIVVVLVVWRCLSMLVTSLNPLMADQFVVTIMSVMKAALFMCVVEACEAVAEPGQWRILLKGLPGCFDPPLKYLPHICNFLHRQYVWIQNCLIHA